MNVIPVDSESVTTRSLAALLSHKHVFLVIGKGGRASRAQFASARLGSDTHRCFRRHTAPASLSTDRGLIGNMLSLLDRSFTVVAKCSPTIPGPCIANSCLRIPPALSKYATVRASQFILLFIMFSASWNQGIVAEATAFCYGYYIFVESRKLQLGGFFVAAKAA